MRIALIVLTSILASAQPLILHQTFEKDTSAWVAFGQGGSVDISHDGQSALAFRYQLQPRQIALAVLPTPAALAGLQRLRFRVKSDHDTAIGMVLNEKRPGGNYSAWFWAPANVWQQIELTPADFSLNEDATDPKDPDGKLDVDQIEGIGILDLAQFFLSLPAAAPMIVDRSTGNHTLLVQDFQALSGDPLTRAPLIIDQPDRGCLDWITPGGIKLQLATSSPLATPALQASYEDTAGRLAILLRRLASFDLAGAKRLAFDIASEHEATLLLSIELRNPGKSQGPRFNLTIFPPADRKLFHVNLSLDDFQHDANSSEADKLDPSRIKSLTVTDVTAAMGGEGGPNTIWIANLRALK